MTARLLADLTDQHLDQVLPGDHSQGPSSPHDDRQVETPASHLDQKLVTGRLGSDRDHTSRMRPVVGAELEEIEDVDHSHDPTRVAPSVHGDPRLASPADE